MLNSSTISLQTQTWVDAAGSWNFELYSVIWENRGIVNSRSILSFHTWKFSPCSDYFAVVSHLFWSLCDSRDEKTQWTCRVSNYEQTASAQKVSETSSNTFSLCWCNSSTNCRHKAATSHQAKPSQSRDESSHVTPNATSASHTELWSRTTPRYWIMRRGSGGKKKSQSFQNSPAAELRGN